MTEPKPQFTEPFPLQPPAESMQPNEHFIDYVPLNEATTRHKDRSRAAAGLLVSNANLNEVNSVLVDMVKEKTAALNQAEAALEESKIDPVTGLKGRKAFEEEYLSAYSRDKNLGVVYVDLNGLNRVNSLDDLHAAGDKFLKETARAIKEVLRKGGHDEVYRIGGDEIAVKVGNANEQVMVGIISRINAAGLKAVDRARIPDDVYAGISAGGAIRSDKDTPESLLARADKHCKEIKEGFYQGIEQKLGYDIRRNTSRTAKAF